MSQAVKIQHYTLEQYLAMEPGADVRHEFIDGELFARVGASRTHNLLVTNLTASLHAHLRGSPCRVLSNDMKVLIERANRVFYPDVLVSCSDPLDELDDYTETRPRLIIEVLSASTAMIDRREKRLAYQQLESLQDYVLVTQSHLLVEVYSRQPDGWLYTIYDDCESVGLPSIGCELAMTLIYEGIELSDSQ